MLDENKVCFWGLLDENWSIKQVVFDNSDSNVLVALELSYQGDLFLLFKELERAI